MTITILLAMSFAGKFTEAFSRQMTAPTAFSIYQHAMLAYLKKAEKEKAPLTEDFIVILQKVTSKDSGAVSSQIDSGLIELLHSKLLSVQKVKGEEFLTSNIKSIISLIAC